MYPFQLNLPESDDLAEQLSAIRKAWLRIPNQGYGYSVLRYIREDSDLTQFPWPEIVFNYVGQVDQDIEASGFGLASESSGSIRDSLQKRPHTIEMSVLIIDSRLMTTLLYDGSRFFEQSMSQFLQSLKEELKTIILRRSAY